MENKESSVQKSSDEKIKKMKENIYSIFFKILLILLIPAIVGAVLGQFIDSRFDIYPWGTLGTLFVFNVLTWIIILRYTGILKIKNTQKQNS